MSHLEFPYGTVFVSNKPATIFGVVLPEESLKYFELYYCGSTTYYFQITITDALDYLVEKIKSGEWFKRDEEE